MLHLRVLAGRSGLCVSERFRSQAASSLLDLTAETQLLDDEAIVEEVGVDASFRLKRNLWKERDAAAKQAAGEAGVKLPVGGKLNVYKTERAAAGPNGTGRVGVQLSPEVRRRKQ